MSHDNKKLSNTTAILGGAGKTGRRIAARLRDRGLPVRMLSRSAERPFDWHDASTWAPALEGAKAMYISYYPDLAIPGAAEQVREVSRVAVDLGVERIVLLAGRGEPQVHPAERAVRESGAEFTILECAFFCQNFSEGLLAPVDGVVVFPAGEVREPFVDCEDIADVAVAALVEAGHAGQTYELTGPRALTFAEATAEMATAAGRPLRYETVPWEVYSELLAPHMPGDHLRFFIELFRFLVDGHNSQPAQGVELALGREARSFRSYAQAAAEAWR